jgi:hypothetical protein
MPAACAQSTFGSSVAGTVRDAAGASVPGAELIIKNLTTDKTERTTTDASGVYKFDNMMSGSYEVIAVKYGFTDAKARIALDARRHVRTDLKLELATVSENASASAVVKELDVMKERIAQLEAQLANR